MSINIKILENYIANFVNNIEYKRINQRLIKIDLIADIDDQRVHHFNTF